ncbi:unnamed protein product, partial [Choristocarpus tenellus]
GRTQHVSLTAPWPTSCLSPLAEAAEFLAEGDEREELLWEYAEALTGIPEWMHS